MRVVCGWCKRELGHKCPRCGSRDFLEDRYKRNECLDCGELYDREDNTPSSSICDVCDKAFRVQSAVPQ